MRADGAEPRSCSTLARAFLPSPSSIGAGMRGIGRARVLIALNGSKALLALHLYRAMRG